VHNIFAQAIDSVLSQDFDNLEIIVVDDGSTDNTREIVERYGKTVKYFYKENGGIASTRNACLRETKALEKMCKINVKKK
jgi:glycosyltransferase involved in cell wall biosynthesis